MSLLGNLFTHYRYTTTDIAYKNEVSGISIQSKSSELNIKVRLNDNVGLPQFSPFCNWKEARRFAGPLPFTFTYDERTKEVLLIEGVRNHWIPRPLEVLEHTVGFIDQLNFNTSVLANAFIIQNIPYYWKKGRKDLWKP